MLQTIFAEKAIVTADLLIFSSKAVRNIFLTFAKLICKTCRLPEILKKNCFEMHFFKFHIYIWWVKIKAFRNFTGKFQEHFCFGLEIRQFSKDIMKLTNICVNLLPIIFPNFFFHPAPKLTMKQLGHSTTQTTFCKGLLKPECNEIQGLQRALHCKHGFLFLPGATSYLQWSLVLLCQSKKRPQNGSCLLSQRGMFSCC